MKILVADDMPADALAPLSARGWDVIVTAGQPRDTLLAALADADALIVRSATKVTADLLDAAPKLRIVVAQHGMSGFGTCRGNLLMTRS